MKKRYIVLGIFILLLGVFIYLSTFTLKTIQVLGCDVVKEETVLNAIKAQNYAGNTLVLYLKNKFKPMENIPFVAKIDMEFVSKNEICVNVYEKSVAGCVEYMNGFVYFDKDGYILESSTHMVDGIPCIKGLTFSSWELGERIPLDDESKFQAILTITQLIEKYDLAIDGIRFTTENEIVLLYKDITIELGSGDYLAIQLMNLKSILEGLDGMKGTLYMKDFDSDHATASFSAK